MKTRLPILVLAVIMVSLSLIGIAAAAPDIDGIWDEVPRSVAPEIGHPRPEDVRLTTEGQAEYESFSKEQDPFLKCIMPGVPLGIYDGYPLEIIQQDHQIVFLYEHFHMVRRIFMDGREPPQNWWPSLVGFSVGNWA